MVESSDRSKPHATSRRRQVLLVEDEPMVRTVWLRIARPLGVELLVVESVEQARTLLETECPDLVVCDWHLGPGRTSEQLIHDLANGDIPLIVTSGDPRALDRLRSSYAVLAKPSHVAEVEAVLLGHPRPASGEAVLALRRRV